eukprot:2432699-Amphidinium_carterae.1
MTSVTSHHDEVVRHAEGPRAVVKPPPTCPPKKPPGPFFDSPHRSDDDEPTGLTVMSPTVPVVSEGKRPPERMVMSPSTPKHSDGNVSSDDWEIATAVAAKKAAAVIAQAKEMAFPSTPKAKPGPEGFNYVPTAGK